VAASGADQLRGAWFLLRALSALAVSVRGQRSFSAIKRRADTQCACSGVDATDSSAFPSILKCWRLHAIRIPRVSLRARLQIERASENGETELQRWSRSQDSPDSTPSAEPPSPAGQHSLSTR